MSKKSITVNTGVVGVVLAEGQAHAVYSSKKRHKNKRKPLFRVRFNYIDDVDRHIEQLTNLKKHMLEAGFPKSPVAPTILTREIKSQKLV